jgi:hypothetical protein
VSGGNGVFNRLFMRSQIKQIFIYLLQASVLLFIFILSPFIFGALIDLFLPEDRIATRLAITIVCYFYTSYLISRNVFRWSCQKSLLTSLLLGCLVILLFFGVRRG